jgi:citrate lyase subunit gamma (acyl carrier protein)
MRIRSKASAGTMQSSDLMVVVEPSETLRIDIDSTVKKQYEHLIRARIEATLGELEVRAGHIKVSDRGALDYAIAARIETAVRRAAKE